MTITLAHKLPQIAKPLKLRLLNSDFYNSFSLSTMLPRIENVDLYF